MKNLKKICMLLGMFAFVACETTGPEDQNLNSDIAYYSVNQEFVLIRDVEALTQSNDEISQHVDSILSGLIDAEVISTGLKSFDLDQDQEYDLSFEIIDLNLFNNTPLPTYLDSLAARVIPVNIEILDNSTYGYPDALAFDYEIKETGNWTNRTAVLGTFANAGQFQGAGEKYLGFRFGGEFHNYGWIKLYCSQHNDTLRIIEYAYNKNKDQLIRAGQKD